MKNFKLCTKTAIVGYTMLCLVLFSSCSGQIVVWNMKDIIGLSILAIGIIGILLLFFIAWIQDKINAWKRKRKKN
jgi:hypothetical protein